MDYMEPALNLPDWKNHQVDLFHGGSSDRPEQSIAISFGELSSTKIG